jgi:hypothetical protein
MKGGVMIPFACQEGRAASMRPAIRYLLGSLLAFGALNAFGGGYYGLAGAEGVPREWLEGTAFMDYFYPSLILLVVVGGTCLLAATAVFARLRLDRVAAVAAAVVLLVWLEAEFLMLGYVSWMQPATAAGTFVLLVLAWLLPSHTAHSPDWPRRAVGFAWFTAMVAGWVGFYVLIAAAEPRLSELHDRVQGLPIVLEGLVWLAFFPYTLGLTIWDSSWPEWLRFGVVSCCAIGWSLAFYPWRHGSSSPQPSAHGVRRHAHSFTPRLLVGSRKQRSYLRGDGLPHEH